MSSSHLPRSIDGLNDSGYGHLSFLTGKDEVTVCCINRNVFQASDSHSDIFTLLFLVFFLTAYHTHHKDVDHCCAEHQ